MDFDVMVVGAGPAGCIAARDLARRGLRVGLFDTRSRDTLGTQVIVEVERSIFHRVGLSTPAGEEIPYHPGRLKVLSPRGRPVYEVEDSVAEALYLDRFARKLLDEAEGAGARFFGGYRARGVVRNGTRVRGAFFRHRRRKEEGRARLVIDATGFEAALVRTLDPDSGIPFREDIRNVVTAANYLHEIDRDRAAEAVKAGLHGDDELWARVGTFGPYSTEFSHLSIRQGRAYILIGHKADFDGPPIDDLVEAFRRRQGYYRKRLHGGKASIRIGHTLDRMVCDGFMTVGEAASMVNPVTGSGVASALLAGHLAARTASRALEDGEATTRALWPYAVNYQRGRGAFLAGFDVIRRLTESLSPEQAVDMIESGISGADDLTRIAENRPFAFSPAVLLSRVRGVARCPRLAWPILRTGVGAVAVQSHYQRYPAAFDPESLRAWTRKRRRLFSLTPG